MSLFQPLAAVTYIVRGSVHQAMFAGDAALDRYLDKNSYRRTRFVPVAESPYARAEVRRYDGSHVAELHALFHA